MNVPDSTTVGASDSSSADNAGPMIAGRTMSSMRCSAASTAVLELPPESHAINPTCRPSGKDVTELKSSMASSIAFSIGMTVLLNGSEVARIEPIQTISSGTAPEGRSTFVHSSEVNIAHRPCGPHVESSP